MPEYKVVSIAKCEQC